MSQFVIVSKHDCTERCRVGVRIVVSYKSLVGVKLTGVPSWCPSAINAVHVLRIVVTFYARALIATMNAQLQTLCIEVVATFAPELNLFLIDQLFDE